MFESIVQRFKDSLRRRDAHVVVVVGLVAIFLLFVITSNFARLYNAEYGEIVNFMSSWFFLPSNVSVALTKPWTIITSILVHISFGHIFRNLLIIYFFGRMVEDLLGKKHFWNLFVFGGVSGGLLYIFAYNIFPLFSPVVDYSTLHGASAGGMALLVGLVAASPRYEVNLFGVFRLRVLWIALFFVFTDLVELVKDNQGGHFAHLSGAAFGYFYVKFLQGGIKFPSFDFNLNRPKKPKFKVTINDDVKPSSRSDYNQDEIDAILDKISKSGYNSLSKKEKEILFKASDKK
jgi:membrane associated rhomboid family serine protease